MGGYIVLITVLALRHEMWRDEVRAFSVATRTVSWTRLFAELHHEGHPIVWYAILRLGYAITHSRLVLPIAGLAIAAVVAYLILRYAPFPVWLRMLAVFGAFLGYELSVVSRNYGIGVLFMICACLAYRSRREQPMLLGLSLALMANTSVHAALGSLVLLCLWLTDLFEHDEREGILSLRGAGSILLGLGGAAIAFRTARPTPDMAWAFSMTDLDFARVFRTIVTDPGKALLGDRDANIAAAGDLPWRVIGLDPTVMSRFIVDLSLAWLAWSLRRSWRALAAIAVTIVGFEILFRSVYTGGLRHEGVVLFLIFSICWMTVVRRREASPAASSRGIAIGLLPLFAFQTAAFPVMAQRYFKYSESSSKAYGDFIRSNPRYRDAILMGEPDYMMETMPYYAGNRVFMPRQGEFHYRTYFDEGQRRRLDLTLGQLIDIADSVSCADRSPVLVAIGYREFSFRPSGEGHPLYKGTVFRWTPAEWARLYSLQPRQRPIASFPFATTDEIYRVYEVSAGDLGSCGSG